MTQKYTGGCQCAKVRYEVQMDIGEVLAVQLLAMWTAGFVAGVCACNSIQASVWRC